MDFSDVSREIAERPTLFGEREVEIAVEATRAYELSLHLILSGSGRVLVGARATDSDRDVKPLDLVR